MLSLPNYWQTILRWREIIICPKCFVYSIHIYCTYSKPNTKWILLSTLGRLISIFLQFRLALKLKLGLSLEKWLLQCKCIQNQYILNVCAWSLTWGYRFLNLSNQTSIVFRAKRWKNMDLYLKNPFKTRN